MTRKLFLNHQSNLRAPEVLALLKKKEETYFLNVHHQQTQTLKLLTYIL